MKSPSKLSKKQEAVLSLTIAGLTDKEIAGALGMSIHTVRTYWDRMREAYGFESRAQVIAKVSADRATELAMGEAGQDAARALADRAELEEILGNMDVFVWVMLPGHKVTYVNQRLVEFMGASSPEDLKERWIEMVNAVIPREYVEPGRQKLDLARALQNIGEAEAPVKGPDGRERWYLIREVPVSEGRGEERRVGVAIDIDELHKRASHPTNTLRLALDISRRGIARWDAGRKRYYSNLAFQRLAGSSDGSENWNAFVAPDQREATELEWQECVETGNSLDIAHRSVKPDGSRAEGIIHVCSTPDGGWILWYEGEDLPGAGKHDLQRLAAVLDDVLDLSAKLESN